MFKAYFLWLLKLLTIIVLLMVLPAILVATFAGMSSELNQSTTHVAGSHKIAVVELKGVIQDSKKVIKDLYRYVDDADIDGIVLRIDSPGGAVGPSQEIYSAVKVLKEKKPIIASMGSVAASGGLYAALGASKILAQPGTLTGSIGVIMQAPNFTKIIDTVGFEMITIKSGKFKDAGNVFRTMTVEDRAFLQSTVDQLYQDFLGAVISSRKLDPTRVAEFADGRVIIGSQAMNYGLVDGIGDLYDAARLVYEVKGKPLPDHKVPQLIFQDDNMERFRQLFENILSWSSALSTGSVLSGPRVYFLMP
jgi:protease-4